MSRPIPPIQDKDLIYGISFVTLHLSLLGSIFVISRVFYRWKKEGTKPITLRFPLYIAITDIIMYFSCMIDQLHNVLYDTDWDGEMCKFIAAAAGFAAALNCILVASISVQVYCSTILKHPIDFGAHDWKLLVFVTSTALILEGIAYKSNGQSWYWCFETMYSPDKTLPIISVVVETTLFGVILFCGLKVLYQIRKVKSRRTKSQKKSNKLFHSKSTQCIEKGGNPLQDEILDRSARKILIFIYNYFVQWSLAVPYVICGIFNYYHKYIILVAVLGFSTGGIWNMIGFIINEGLYDRPASKKQEEVRSTSHNIHSVAKLQED